MEDSTVRFIKPMLIGDLEVLSCNVPSTIQPDYVPGTTYGAGVLAGTTVGTVQSVYKSLQANNLGRDPATSPLWWEAVGVVYEQYNPNKPYAVGDVVQLDNPAFTVTLSSLLVNALAHFRLEDEFGTLSTTGALPPEYSTGVEYFIVQPTANSFKLSKTKGGPPIVASSSGSGVHTFHVNSHLVYESVVAANLGNVPYKTLTTCWLEQGVVNAHQMFDSAYQTATQNMGSIEVSLRTRSLVNSVALLNSEGMSATVTQVESGHTQTKPLRRHPVSTWYKFYFTRPIFVDDLIFEDIPPVVGGTLQVVVNGSTGVAKCGVMVAGDRFIVGLTEDGLTREIDDYSITQPDKFGTISPKKRGYSQLMRLDVMVERSSADRVTRFLERNRATELVAVGITGYSMTYLYCILGKWTFPLKNGKSLLNLQLKGLV